MNDRAPRCITAVLTENSPAVNSRLFNLIEEFIFAALEFSIFNIIAHGLKEVIFVLLPHSLCVSAFMAVYHELSCCRPSIRRQGSSLRSAISHQSVSLTNLIEQGADFICEIAKNLCGPRSGPLPMACVARCADGIDFAAGRLRG